MEIALWILAAVVGVPALFALFSILYGSYYRARIMSMPPIDREATWVIDTFRYEKLKAEREYGRGMLADFALSPAVSALLTVSSSAVLARVRELDPEVYQFFAEHHEMMERFIEAPKKRDSDAVR